MEKAAPPADPALLERALPAAARLLPVDALRGLIIILMALDHANFFVAQQHSSGEYWGGPFPAYNQALPFLTRFVTHIAAPGFFFLMGAGMLLFTRSRQKLGWSRWALLRHFWIRGALLILLQLLLVNRAWALAPQGWGITIYIGVLFALGGTMILAAPLLWLRPRFLLLLAALLFLVLALLAPDPLLWSRLPENALDLLLLYPGGDGSLWSNYPILPWLPLVIFGLWFGGRLSANARAAYRDGLRLGAAFLLAFVILRALDGFGNIRPRPGDGWIDFLNVVKYPPSLTFSLLTIGLNLVILGLFGRAGAWARRPLELLAVFGRTPLFFYLLHLFLYAALGRLLAPSGSSIPAMLPLWLLGLALLYPLCLAFGRFMARRPVRSVWRFL